MFVLGLVQTIDHMAMARSVYWYGYVLREYGHVLRMALGFVVQGQWKKGNSPNCVIC